MKVSEEVIVNHNSAFILQLNGPDDRSNWSDMIESEIEFDSQIEDHIQEPSDVTISLNNCDINSSWKWEGIEEDISVTFY